MYSKDINCTLWTLTVLYGHKLDPEDINFILGT